MSSLFVLDTLEKVAFPRRLVNTFVKFKIEFGIGTGITADWKGLFGAMIATAIDIVLAVLYGRYALAYLMIAYMI